MENKGVFKGLMNGLYYILSPFDAFDHITRYQDNPDIGFKDYDRTFFDISF